MAKTQTKTEIRNAAAKAEKLLRGIDNQTEQARKDQKKLDARWDAIAKDAAQVRTLISGITPVALNNAGQTAQATNGQTAKSNNTNKTTQKPSKPVAKAGGSIGTKKKTATPKKTTAAKPKAQAASKSQKGQGSAKKPTGKAQKPNSTANKNRRPLKEAMNDVLAEAGPLLPADLYKQVTKREGYYSRQSLYMALKSNDYRKLTDGRYDRAATTVKSNGKTTSNDEADNFVASVDNNAAVASVQ